MKVAIVTARAGSKSIIDKHILPLRGKPMVQYPIHAAQATKRIAEVCVSTDGDGIAAASRAGGAKTIRVPTSSAPYSTTASWLSTLTRASRIWRPSCCCSAIRSTSTGRSSTADMFVSTRRSGAWSPSPASACSTPQR
ncbi:cytidylyltransferase domain-containing protein [Mesorhizobium sp. BHbsci]